MKGKIIFITQTAVMLALLIGVQFATRPLGNQFITGSLVNLILLVTTFLVGVKGGLSVGVLSPFLAFLAGIGFAFIQLVPFLAIGNAVLVLTAGLVRKHIARKNASSILLASIGLIAASAAKTAFLWLGIVIIALPMLLSSGIVNERQAEVIGAAFSLPQLVTALIGSALAMTIVPLLKKAMPTSFAPQESYTP